MDVLKARHLKKILFIADTTKKLFNGVQTTINNLTKELLEMGHFIHKIDLDQFHFSVSRLCPDAPYLSLKTDAILNMIQAIEPDHIHIFTEGILGFSAKKACRRLKLSHTSSYHTHFDLYLKKRFFIPTFLPLMYLKSFHQDSDNIIVPTVNVANKIKSLLPKKRISIIARGVDQNIFYCENPHRKINSDYPKCVYAGRVAKEKNIETFLATKINSEKIIVGDGPHLPRLKKKFPEAVYMGYRNQAEIRKILNQCDVAVFPSKTDTFGIAILEALACGLPVAAYPVAGPRDILKDKVTGSLNEDLTSSIKGCLQLSRASCVHFSKQFCWRTRAQEFLQAFSQI